MLLLVTAISQLYKSWKCLFCNNMKKTLNNKNNMFKKNISLRVNVACDYALIQWRIIFLIDTKFVVLQRIIVNKCGKSRENNTH